MIKWELEKSEYVKKFGPFDEEAAKEYVWRRWCNARKGVC